MKIYRCYVLNQNYQKCSGMIEAEDEEDAKEKIIAQGFSILSLEEVSSKVRITRYGFQEINEDGSFVNPPPTDIEPKELPKTLNKHHFFILLGVMISLFACYAFFIILPRFQETHPENVVHEYMEYGYASQWQEQFRLLEEEQQEFFTSIEQYATSMETKWESYPAKSVSEKASTESQMINNELYRVELLDLSKVESKFKVSLNYPREVKELIFLLRPFKKDWKIAVIGDVDRMQKYIERLAEGVRPDIEEKMISELKQSFSYTDEEIILKVRQAKIKRLQRMREEELLRRERLEQKKEERQEEEQEVKQVQQNTTENSIVESDLLQEKLDETLKMVENLGN